MTIWMLICFFIICLVVFISVFKIQPFISFLLVAIGLGLSYQLTTQQCIAAIQKGIGSTLGSIIPILVLGAMIGKMIAKSGSASIIADWLVKVLGYKKLPLAFMLIGFVVGLPLFFSVGFLLLVPVVLATAKKFNIQAVYIGIPLLASLSITQGYLPPHPAPYYLVTNLPGADMGITLGLGIIISIPAMFISGLWFAKTLKKIPSQPMNFIQEETVAKPPLVSTSLLILLLPVFLIGIHSFCKNAFPEGSIPGRMLLFAGEPVVALLLSLATAIYFLGFKRDIPWAQMQDWLNASSKEVTPLILIFAGAGAFKEILQEMHVGDAIAIIFNGSSLNPLIFAWVVAALIRIITGSSTVSGITTAGLIEPMLNTVSFNPNLMVLSIGAGSLFLSHVNDGGFWLFREYFGVSFKDTLKSWTIMETLIAITGLVGVLLLQYFFY
jgi:gluconate transporter